MVRTTVVMPRDLHRLLRVSCAADGCRIGAAVIAGTVMYLKLADRLRADARAAAKRSILADVPDQAEEERLS
jgi:hypothetical protein